MDRDGEAGVRRALDGARLVIVDAPRTEDKAQIERFAGKRLRDGATPTLHIIVFATSPRSSTRRTWTPPSRSGCTSITSAARR